MVTVTNAEIAGAAAKLKERGFQVTQCEDNQYAVLILEAYHMPTGWSKTEIRLLLKLPASFPNGKPDMFWTDDDLTLADGGEPDKAQVFENICGCRWRRFSWHLEGWTPGKDDIHTFLEFIDRRLAQRR